jgi:hypothetical protein
MKRLFWLGLGVAVGVVVARQVTKAVQSYSPSGLAGEVRHSAGGILDSVREFIADVREGMAEREAEIHAALEQGISLAELDERRHNELDGLRRDELAERQHDAYETGPGFRG